MKLTTEEKQTLLDGINALISAHKMAEMNGLRCTQPDNDTDNHIMHARLEQNRLAAFSKKLRRAWTKQVTVTTRTKKEVWK